MNELARRHIPLTPVAFDILLAVGNETRHGYAIMRDVENRNAGRGNLHPGTLYRALGRLVHAGLLEELDERPAPDADDSRRRAYFRLSELGRLVTAAEADRLEDQVGVARSKNLFVGTPSV